MVSEANPEAHHQFPLFQHGDPVEVSTDEEGFAGAWFPASIVDSNASRKSNSKRKKKKVVVRYDTLLKEDGRTPLTESVDPAFVRPIPPGDDGDAKRGFEVNDLVDAKDKDGWWSGVVAKVLQGGKRYRVLFYNPPDFIDCGENDLRFHWDWIFGKWVRPNKLTQTPSKGEGIFDPGADVEVNLDKETVGDTWLSAVVIERSSDQTFLVKCQGLDSLDDDAEVLATKEDVVVVDLQHIRPTPPCHSRTGYELLDHVDGLIAGSWRKGLITEVTKGKYTIFFKQREEEKVLSLSKLRPHLDWDDGEWKSKSNAASKGLVVALTNTEKLDSGDTSADNLQLAVVPVSPGASYDNINEKNPYSSITRIKMDESTLSSEKSASNLFASSNKKRKVIPDISGKQLSHCDSLMEGDTEETPLSVRRQNQSSNQKGTSSFTVEKNLRGSVKPQKERLSNAKSSPDRNRLSTKTKKRRGNLVDLDCQKPAMVVYSSKKNPAMVASIGRYTKAPVGSSLVSAADKEDSPENRTSTLVNNGEDVLKEDAVPLILGLGEGRMSHSSNSSPSRAGDRLNSLGDKKRGSESSGEGSLEHSDGRKRGRALKYSAKDVKMDAGCMSVETSDTESDGKKIVVKAVTDEVGRQLVLELESTVYLDKQNEAVEKSADVYGIVNSVNEADTSLVGAPEGVAEDDQPLLSSWGRFASPISTHEDRLSTPSVDGCHGRKKSQSVSTDSDALLFVKKSPLWASLEAMDIFRNVPQRPHFLPLKHCEEKYREGVAVGIMVTFGNIFEEISSLTINHSTESLQSSLKSLSEFESYGFDVSVLRRRINKLQTMKSQHIEWLTEAENAERELDEHVEEQRKSEAVLKELEEKMLALQQLVASAKGDMEAKVARGVLLGAHVDKIKARIGYASSAFERVAKSPWRVQG